MDDLTAIYICEGLQDATEDELVAAWHHLIDTGLVWQLRGGSMMYANRIGYSDVTPFEVVDYVSLKMLDICEMVATEKPWMRQFMAGGFLGHVVNQEDQDWDIQPDPDAPLVRIRKRKDGKWYDRDGARYALADKPVKFHDFNF